MRKVLISVLVSSLLLGTIIAKPKAKVETPVPEPVPEMTFQEWCEQVRTTVYSGFYPGLTSDFVVYGLAREDSLYSWNNWNRIYCPEYYHFWFVSDWSTGIWGPYEVDVSPYKKETRGHSSKEDFIQDLYYKGDHGIYGSRDPSSPINATYVKALSQSLSDSMPSYRFSFAWVFPDGYFAVSHPGINYDYDKFYWIKPKTRNINYDPYEHFRFFPQGPSYSTDYDKVYKADEFFDVLEARLKKEGTKEQLESFYIFKEYLISCYSK